MTQLYFVVVRNHCRMQSWSDSNKLTLNLSKTKCIIFVNSLKVYKANASYRMLKMKVYKIKFLAVIIYITYLISLKECLPA